MKKYKKRIKGRIKIYPTHKPNERMLNGAL